MKKTLTIVTFAILLLNFTFNISARTSMVFCPKCANPVAVIKVAKKIGEVPVKCSHYPNGKDYLFHYQYYDVIDCECGYYQEILLSGQDFTAGYRCEGY